MLRNPRADKSISKSTPGFTPRNANGKHGLPAVCAGVQARLTRYLDGELNAPERQRLQTHLDTCAACREELRQFASSEQMLGKARQSAPSPGDLRSGFYARLHAAPSPARTKINWRIATPAFAACGLLLAFSASFYLHPAAPGSAVSSTDMAQANSAKPHAALQAPQRAVAFGRPASSRALTRTFDPALRKSSVAVAGRARAGKADFNASSRIFSAQARAWNYRTGRAQSALHSFRPRRAGYPMYAISAMRSPFLSSLPRPARLKPARMQVALLSKWEVHGLSDRAAEYNLSAAPRTFGFDSAVKSDQDTNSLAYAPLSPGSAPPSERAKSEAANFLYDARAVEKMGRETADVRRRGDTFALASPPADAADNRGAGFGEAPAGADGVSFRVRDTRRGFESGTRAASEVQQREGRQVLSIRMEDDDARRPETGGAGGAASGKTGNQESDTPA